MTTVRFLGHGTADGLHYEVTDYQIGRWWWKQTLYRAKCQETGVVLANLDKESLDMLIAIVGLANMTFIVSAETAKAIRP